MIKNIVLTLITFIILLPVVYGNGTNKEAVQKAQESYQLTQAQNRLDELDAQNRENAISQDNFDLAEALSNQMEERSDLQSQIDTLTAKGVQPGTKEQLDAAKDKYDKSSESKEDFSSIGFQIDVSTENGMLGGMGFQPKSMGKNTSEVINYTLGTIIQKLMIALGVLAVLIMTVGAGYIIMYHGQDELLSKGKSIFMAGITALVVALSSYYIVSILRFILYN